MGSLPRGDGLVARKGDRLALMTPTLAALLRGPIDYAGLYPPAELSMARAVDEYLRAIRSDDAWIVDRFVCGAPRLTDLVEALPARADEPVGVTVVGTPLSADPGQAVRQDAEAIQRAARSEAIEVYAFEVRLAQGEATKAAAGALKRLPSLIEDEGLDLYVEVGWGEGMVEAMHEVAAQIEGAGFKARTGGVTADAFPSTDDLAQFLSEAVALEAPFKFTAGLHEPIRYRDEALGVWRHGFLNAMMAGALALAHDLSRREIQTLLEVTDPGEFFFGSDECSLAGHPLTLEDIDEFWDFFGGFGSCSIDEPLAGLRRLGLLEGAGA